MQPLFLPDRFAHANLFVADVEESVAFYRDVCGITEVFREPDIKAGFLSNGATHHDVGLMQVSTKPLIGRDGTVQNTMAKGRRPGLNHLAFHVASEATLIEAYRSAAQHGITVEKSLDHGMSRSLYLIDPDNVTVEFYVDTVADWRTYYAEHQNELISAQWNPDAEPPATAFTPPGRCDTRVPGAEFASVEICGATLAVSDLAASRHFYEAVGGLEALNADSDSALLGIPGSSAPCLALVVAGDGEQAGLRSLWFLAEAGSRGLEGSDHKAVQDPNGIGITFFAGSDALPRAAGWTA
jgi:catechol 2,3-dioxygenase